MEFDKMEQTLRSRPELTAVLKSPEGQAAAAQIDEAALRSAAKRGDTAALKTMLAELLSSPEGKALAARVQKAVGNK